MGFFLLRYFEYFEKIWKTKNQKKKWLMTCGFFFIIACLSGWLR